jgi:uncharacterized protein YciI
MLYALIAEDTPDPQKRLDARPDHLKHLESLGDRLVLAGPFLTAEGGMAGSFMVIEAESLEEAEALFGQDPFMQRGVFASVSIRPWKLSINNSAGR